MIEPSRVGVEDEWCCGIVHAYLVIYIVAIILAGTTGKIHLVGLSCLYPSNDVPSDANRTDRSKNRWKQTSRVKTKEGALSKPNSIPN
jgi:hypothetical protein